MYGVYYGKSVAEMSSAKAKLFTSGESVVVEKLDACEVYLFDVSIVGPDGIGPLTERPVTVRTKMDELAPPKRVSVKYFHDSPDRLSVNVTWNAPCSVLDKPLSYDVSYPSVSFILAV